MEKKNILIVDDSSYVHVVLNKIFKKYDFITVIGKAFDGEEAVVIVNKCSPDIIIMDIDMPKKNGLEAIRDIMEQKPTPIIVFSEFNSMTEGLCFQAMDLGAVEIVEKPCFEDQSNEMIEFEDKLIRAIKTFVNFRVMRRIKLPVINSLMRHAKKLEDLSNSFQMDKGKVVCDSIDNDRKCNLLDKQVNFPIIAIAASTGGPQTVKKMLEGINCVKMNAAYIILQHMSDGFIDGYLNWITDISNIPVKFPQKGETLAVNTIYVAPACCHLGVDSSGKFDFFDTPPISGIRPSADILFESMSEVYKDRLIAIILTGMGGDGSGGIFYVKKNGGYVIAQDEESSLIFGMPRVAIESGNVDKVLHISKVAAFLEGFYNERFCGKK